MQLSAYYESAALPTRKKKKTLGRALSRVLLMTVTALKKVMIVRAKAENPRQLRPGYFEAMVPISSGPGDEGRGYKYKC